MARVLILGCGDLGSRLASRLVSSGHHVIGARRRADRLPEGVDGVSFDLDDEATFERLPVDFDWLVWTGAPSGRADEAGYRRVYVEGPTEVLANLALRGAHPSVVLWASSTSVYDVDDGSTVDERTEAMPSGFRGRAVLDSERAAEHFARGTAGTAFHVVRFGGIYGPGREYLIDSVRSRRAILPADGDGPWTNRIHVDDAAAALQLVAESAARKSQQFSKVLLGVDEHPARRGEVLRFLAERLGVELPVESGAKSDASGADRRGGDKRCVARALRELGFRWSYPSYREGYAALLDS